MPPSRAGHGAHDQLTLGEGRSSHRGLPNLLGFPSDRGVSPGRPPGEAGYDLRRLPGLGVGVRLPGRARLVPSKRWNSRRCPPVVVEVAASIAARIHAHIPLRSPPRVQGPGWDARVHRDGRADSRRRDRVEHGGVQPDEHDDPAAAVGRVPAGPVGRRVRPRPHPSRCLPGLLLPRLRRHPRPLPGLRPGLGPGGVDGRHRRGRDDAPRVRVHRDVQPVPDVRRQADAGAGVPARRGSPWRRAAGDDPERGVLAAGRCRPRDRRQDDSHQHPPLRRDRCRTAGLRRSVHVDRARRLAADRRLRQHRREQLRTGTAAALRRPGRSVDDALRADQARAVVRVGPGPARGAGAADGGRVPGGAPESRPAAAADLPDGNRHRAPGRSAGARVVRPRPGDDRRRARHRVHEPREHAAREIDQPAPRDRGPDRARRQPVGRRAPAAHRRARALAGWQRRRTPADVLGASRDWRLDRPDGRVDVRRRPASRPSRPRRGARLLGPGHTGLLPGAGAAAAADRGLRGVEGGRARRRHRAPPLRQLAPRARRGPGGAVAGAADGGRPVRARRRAGGEGRARVLARRQPDRRRRSGPDAPRRAAGPRLLPPLARASACHARHPGGQLRVGRPLRQPHRGPPRAHCRPGRCRWCHRQRSGRRQRVLRRRSDRWRRRRQERRRILLLRRRRRLLPGAAHPRAAGAELLGGGGVGRRGPARRDHRPAARRPVCSRAPTPSASTSTCPIPTRPSASRWRSWAWWVRHARA